MSRGIGKVQFAIIDRLNLRPGGDVVEAYYESQIRLATGIHDMRQVAAEMNENGRGFSDPRKQAAFSRAVAGLVERGILKAHSSLVPISEYWPDRAWSNGVLELADGTYLSLPKGPAWRRRFASLA